MGYTSDVAFSIRGKKDDVIAKITAFRLGGGKHEKAALDACSYVEYGEVIIISFHGTSIKWYSEYPEVKALNALFAAFSQDDEADEKYDCAFVRLGEDSADTEEAHIGNDPYDLAYLRRGVGMMYDYDADHTLEKLLCPTTPS